MKGGKYLHVTLDMYITQTSLFEKYVYRFLGSHV